MANPEHVEILRQGVGAWNEWRETSEDYADLTGATYSGADLSKANFYADYLNGADLSGANLGWAALDVADLNGANLAGARLNGAGLTEAWLSGANLSGADLTEARLHSARLRGADLSEARLDGALLNGVNLARADLTGTHFTEAILHRALLASVDLSTVVGLDTCRQHGPSSIDIETLTRSGPLPEVFLRGCGLPDNIIEYLPSLLSQPIRFYSCFISFTEADDELAQRLYNDLQGEGVRCWRWKEDAKWGRSLIGEIDQAVRLHDKLVVLCSANSLKSKPVIREIERALQREDRLFRQGDDSEVLFPINLDGYIFDGWEHPRKADVLEKTVGDFTDWKDHDKYRASFDRLLRSLKPDAPHP